MLVLALDTTTRAGSLALTRDGAVLEVFVGDATRTHAARLPGDLLDCLRRHGLGPRDADILAVAAGPGSFTGLRIGIATMQGLAFANGKRMVGVSALEALAQSAGPREQGRARVPGIQEPGAGSTVPGFTIGAWMDAQRGEVYAELFTAPGGGDDLEVVVPASVGAPAEVLDAWRGPLSAGHHPEVALVGDGALKYKAVVEAADLPGLRVVEVVPALAPIMARIAERAAREGQAVAPHAIRPLYIRRPDAELARERARRAAEQPGQGAASPSDRGSVR